jgi:hypothetical protein
MEGSGWIMSIHEIEIPTCDGNGRQPLHCISGIFFEFIYNLVCPVLLPERHADASLKVASNQAGGYPLPSAIVNVTFTMFD